MGFIDELHLEDILQDIITVLTSYGLDVLGAIIILIIGNVISKRVPNTVRNLMTKRNIDLTVVNFLASLVRMLILTFTVLLVLAQFGVQTASLIAVLGAAGLAVGLALQGTLSNVAGGVMLLFFRPVRVGDFVEAAGHSGTVKAVNLFTTELATVDNVQIILPNASIWGGAIKNYSFHENRRVDLVIGIAYSDDIDKAMGTMATVIAADPRSHKDPEPMIAVSDLGDSSVNFTVRIWCDGGDYWPLKFDMTKAIKEAFDKDGISIPFPQRDVHLIKEA